MARNGSAAARGKAGGYAMAALSSATFGLAPLFTLRLLGEGFSTFEVLAYRWGIAAAALTLFAVVRCERLRIGRRERATVLSLAVLRAATSLSLVVAYENIASGAASTIHFIYPLFVALVMMGLFGERRQRAVGFAVVVSLAGAALLASGSATEAGGSRTVGLCAAAASVLFYGGYIVGVRRSRAATIPSAALTCCVMGLGALFFVAGGLLTGGIRLAAGWGTWLSIAGLALPATALSNIALVTAIKRIGPTLTSVFGALEPLTAVVAGACLLGEPFTVRSGAGVVLVVAAVVTVVVSEGRKRT